VLGPLLGHSSCVQSGERSVCVEQQIDDKTKKVEVILSSYHSAIDFREELVHGFILVYSSRRKASIATLSAFSMNIPELPIQVVAVTDAPATNFHMTQELNQVLVAEGNNLADQLNAHFLTSESNQKKNNFYNNFFREVCEKKAEIEKAFSMDERLSGRLDDSGEGTLERPPRRHPVPPPRLDSYHITGSRERGPSSLNSRSGSGRSGSGSEIFDRLPDSGLHGDELDSPGSEDSDVYSQIDSLDRHPGGQAQPSRRSNGEGRPLKPGQQLRPRNKPHKGVSSAPPECSPPPIPSFPPRPRLGGAGNAPPAYTSRTTDSSPKARPSGYSRQPVQSTFSSPGGPTKPAMYKAESMTLETMRGDRSTNHSSFFPEQGMLGGRGGGSPPEPAPRDPHLDHIHRAVLVARAHTMPGLVTATSLEDVTCWVDDSGLERRRAEEEERLAGKFPAQGAFTTGRGRPSPRSRPESGSQRSQESIAAPGKLNLQDYQHVTSALSRIQVKPRSAPLAQDEEQEEGGYAVPRDVVSNGVGGTEYAQPMVEGGRGQILEGGRAKPAARSKNRERRERLAKIDYSDSDSDSSSDDRPAKKPGAVRKARKRPVAKAVATPVVPPSMPNPMTRPTEQEARPAVLVDKRGFTDSDESDSYAGDLVGDSGDLFTRVRRFQGSSGPPGGPGFPAGAPPRRPGFMFPPPPSGPPPEPGDLYSVLQCKEIKSKPKKPKGTNLDLFKFVSNLAQQIPKGIDVVAGLNFMNAYEIQKLLIW